jgi:hypothetical protein
MYSPLTLPQRRTRGDSSIYISFIYVLHPLIQQSILDNPGRLQQLINSTPMNNFSNRLCVPNTSDYSKLEAMRMVARMRKISND